MKILSATDIARIRGVSRQRVWALAARRGIAPRGKLGGVSYWLAKDLPRFAPRGKGT